MMPVVKGETSTRLQIFIYALILAAAGITPFVIGMSGVLYLAVSAAFGAGFVLLSWRVYRERNGEYAHAKKLFGFSLIYLFALFAALLADKMVMAYV